MDGGFETKQGGRLFIDMETKQWSALYRGGAYDAGCKALVDKHGCLLVLDSESFASFSFLVSWLSLRSSLRSSESKDSLG